MAVDDVVSQVLWTNYFLEAQGFSTSGTVVYQDNESSILLETNGKMSRGKRSKHISVRYFFIKDRVDSGELSIEWCSSENMVADLLTKPLQGDTFLAFRDVIMNVN